MELAMQRKIGKLKKEDQGRLVLSCPNQPGIVAEVTRFLYEREADIIQIEQHMDEHFFLRVVFQCDQFERRIEEIRQQFAPIAESYEMQWRMVSAARKHRLAIFVSKEGHCLQDLLWRFQTGELEAEISMVISNHADLKPLVEPYGIPYYHVPVTKETREEAARIHMELLEPAKIDTIILARYMQIIPSWMTQRYRHQIINIHHSFLPAFAGAKPYHRAYERGVKMIGATAHYVTEELDQGPIIEQDVKRVDHRYSVEDLKRIGRDIERIVLARAVRWHIQDQVMVDGNRTIVFSGI
ncbi:formyltetrahydrofolate deformylase [Thermoflavimicrobium dichotomicum]|uniref:Formyltetrahydrofolate deformylase n=1 Tax=Thermoflavimicrobium dichotomicum TaxID=46223 RepID=A0A1I3RN02_9BACL|nr:formyltetrahydrofolate deformylase [Thermoflavimicrobium dichotomicum]SFJ47648.1 formyltetrahydrofolate deformylase [Thermoflavimicrobium dichotomicum]